MTSISKELPAFLTLLFVLITLATLLISYWVVRQSISLTVRERAPLLLLMLIGWLPTFIVPVVVFGQLVSIPRCLSK